MPNRSSALINSSKLTPPDPSVSSALKASSAVRFMFVFGGVFSSANKGWTVRHN